MLEQVRGFSNILDSLWPWTNFPAKSENRILNLDDIRIFIP